MSRIGRKHIDIPAGVDVTLASDNVITVKGPKGELTRALQKDMIVKIDGNIITVERPSEDRFFKSLHGLTRTLIANMIEGVTNGYSKTLEIQGVGYRVQKQGNKAVFSIGYSHPVEIAEVPGIKIDIPDGLKIVVSGPDKQQVGQFAAKVREIRPPEPYHGKGIRYAGEYIKLKEGKAGKAKK